MSRVDLRLTSRRGYDPGRPYWVRAAWLVVEALILLNPLVTHYGLKRWTLRQFGARVGRQVIIKPNVHVKYPWHLSVGDHAWIGERSWIDNFVRVDVGAHAVISQGAYLCTGNHDWSDPGMPLVVKPIVVEDGAWIAAFARVGPGVIIGREAVVTLGSVLLADAEASGIYRGNPALKVGDRVVGDRPRPK
jgi:putative colanic acid biosynthesis acetyltransferase WcaF